MVDDLAEVTIRTASVEDAEPIARVHIASLREGYAGVIADDYLATLDVDERAERWRAQLAADSPDTKVWVAEQEGAVVGFASLAPSRDEDAERDTLEIPAIYLEPSAWGHGVARELMRTVVAAVPENVSVTLWVLDANERARHFYRRNGFSPDGVERLEEIGGQAYREIRYRRG